jgi:alanine dehydrogenase
MRIGIPREIKDGERRVGVVPDGVRALVADGHAVLLERAAGAAAGPTTATTCVRARRS